MILGIDASLANNDKKTGVEWYAYHIIEGLKKEIPSDVEVVLYSKNKLKDDLADLPVNWQIKVLSWPPKFLWTQFRLSFEMLFHKPDILFIPGHVHPFVHPKKTAMMIHDLAPLKTPESYGWFTRLYYSWWGTKMAVKKLWKIIVPSEFVKEEMKK